MNFDRRSETRERVNLAVCLPDGGTGVTGDVSVSGLYFESSGTFAPGSTIALSIVLPDDLRPLRLKAQGEVVRFEPRGHRSGIAVRILASTLEAVSREAGQYLIH